MDTERKVLNPADAIALLNEYHLGNVSKKIMQIEGVETAVVYGDLYYNVRLAYFFTQGIDVAANPV